MTKQSHIFGFITFKLLAFVTVGIALIFAYSEIAKYNYPLHIEFADYKIDTYIGFIIFALLLIMSILFFLNGVFTSIILKFQSIKDRYHGTKTNESINGLIESYIMYSFNNKKDALSHLNKVDKNYLNNDQKDYAELLNSLSSHDSIPIALYGYIQKFPILNKQISKKLAYIEFKLGNLDKALEYAREYYSISMNDEKISILLAQIYAKKEDWKAMDGVISSLSGYDMSEDLSYESSRLYMLAAKYYLAETHNNDSLTYCRKALEINPGNLDAASLFAEIASGQRNYDLSTKVLISCFSAKPNFELFLILKKFTNLSNLELYNELVDSCEYESNISIFLAISTFLELTSKQKEILDKIQ